jgi:hypothetical protein
MPGASEYPAGRESVSDLSLTAERVGEEDKSSQCAVSLGGNDGYARTVATHAVSITRS